MSRWAPLLRLWTKASTALLVPLIDALVAFNIKARSLHLGDWISFTARSQ